MKALVKAHDEPGLWLQEMPKPEPGPEDVLIKVNEVAICGTDLHIYNWDQWAQEHVPVPMIVGHEYIGIIEEIGELVHSVEVGDRVSGEGHIMCGECRNCRAGRGHLCRDTRGVGVNRPGAFAEYVCIPAQNAYKIPEQISDDIASILDPLGNAVHTALSFDLVGEDVLITGAGPHRFDGNRGGAACRCAARGDHRCQRNTFAHGGSVWRDAHGQGRAGRLA